NNLYDSLAVGGYLIVSPSEMSNIFNHKFVSVNFSGATFYKKDNKKRKDKQNGERPAKTKEVKPSATLWNKGLRFDLLQPLVPISQANTGTHIHINIKTTGHIYNRQGQ
ncbi:MAG: hypothetical protein ACUZ8O_00065, partial [Candidatus Anammoxibacter sp.]